MRVTPVGARDFGMSFVSRRQSIGHIAVMAHCTEARCGALLPSERAAISALGARVGRYFNATYDVFDDRVRTKFAACNPRGNPNLLACAAHVVQFLGANARTVTIIDLHAAWLADRAREAPSLQSRLASQCFPFEGCVAALRADLQRDGTSAGDCQVTASETNCGTRSSTAVVRTLPVMFDGVPTASDAVPPKGPPEKKSRLTFDFGSKTTSPASSARRASDERCRLWYFAEQARYFYTAAALSQWRATACNEPSAGHAVGRNEDAPPRCDVFRSHRPRWLVVPVERFPVLLAMGNLAAQIDAPAAHSVRFIAELLTVDYAASMFHSTCNGSTRPQRRVVFKTPFQCGPSRRDPLRAAVTASATATKTLGANETRRILATPDGKFEAADELKKTDSEAPPPFWQYRHDLSGSAAALLPTTRAPLIAISVKANHLLLRPHLKTLVDDLQRRFRRVVVITGGEGPHASNSRFHPFPKALLCNNALWNGWSLMLQTEYYRWSSGMLFLHLDAYFSPRSFFAGKSLDEAHVALPRGETDGWEFWDGRFSYDSNNGERYETMASMWGHLTRNLYRYFVLPTAAADNAFHADIFRRRWNSFADIFYLPRRAFEVASAVASQALPHPLTPEGINQQIVRHVEAFGIRNNDFDYAGGCCNVIYAALMSRSAAGHKWLLEDESGAREYHEQIRGSMSCERVRMRLAGVGIVAPNAASLFASHAHSAHLVLRSSIAFWGDPSLLRVFDAPTETCPVEAAVEAQDFNFRIAESPVTPDSLQAAVVGVRALLSNDVKVTLQRLPVRSANAIEVTLMTPNANRVVIGWSDAIVEAHALELRISTGVSMRTAVYAARRLGGIDNSDSITDQLVSSNTRQGGAHALAPREDCESVPLLLDCRPVRGLSLDEGDDVVALFVPRGWQGGAFVEVFIDTSQHLVSRVFVVTPVTRGNDAATLGVKKGLSMFP